MDVDGLMTGILGVLGIVVLLLVAIIVFVVYVNWKMFEKAGKPGWASIIPIYNTIVLFEIIDINGITYFFYV